MAINSITLLTSIYLISLGFYCMIFKRNMFRIIIGFNIFEVGIILLLLSVGYREGAVAPLIKEGIHSGSGYVDPLPQALGLTVIVIGVGITALAMSLIIKLDQHYHTVDVSEISARCSAQN